MPNIAATTLAKCCTFAADGSGNAYVTGSTASTNFPVAIAVQGTFSGGSGDAFVAELTATGRALGFTTYLGGNGDDSASGIAVDSAGNAYVTGYTTSSRGSAST